MRFSVLQEPRYRIQIFLKGNLLLPTMSFAGILSESSHHLRNTHNFNLLRLSTCWTSGRVLSTGSCNLRPLSTKVEGRSKKQWSNKPCNINLEVFDGTVRRTTKLNVKKSDFFEFKSIQNDDVQQKVAYGRDCDRSLTIFVFDIETTGFSRHTDRIIEFALQDLLGGKNSTFQTLVNPERTVPNAKIHGISTHMVNRSDVPRWKDLVPILLKYVQSRQKVGGLVLWVAHNGRRFDVPFLIKEFSRCSMDLPPDWLFVDTLPLARQLVKPDGSKLSTSTLAALRNYYEIPLMGSAHRAMSDVNSLSLILQKMTFDLKLPISGLLERSFKASDITQVRI
ncbi:polynucleotidyl transferase, ribonuclease H-like superfamily protein isoform X2 [Tasmannia lanceolata]|uniref:polynucleotidyl transferase, ribonuclease H-like superfamily protein isoform X2 n=1 Tax=Tasmannia lanceolata TaxID=3420 RepID=UPI0040639695